MENYKSDIQSIVFLGEYPKAERYSFLKRNKLVPISKCITKLITDSNTSNLINNSFKETNKTYCIINPDKFTKLRTHKIKAFCNDSHIRYVEMVIGYY